MYSIQYFKAKILVLDFLLGYIKYVRKAYTFIDLFAGCGGLSEGFYQEGFQPLLHLEIDPVACKTLKTRMRFYGYSKETTDRVVLCEDITKENILEITDNRVSEHVDLIIGGPPCQAFSTVGRAQDPNSMDNDPRNYLFENYLKILNHYKPKAFIFENVKGLLSAHPKGVHIFNLIISKMGETYNIVDDPNILLLNAVNYGVPQIRERLIIIGVRKDIDISPIEIYRSIKKTHYSPDLINNNLKKYVTVRDAISDLPPLKPGEGVEICDYKGKIENEYIALIRPNIHFDKLYNHVARNHNSKDCERYRILSENGGWQLKDLQKVRPDLIHHDPSHFGNRYTVQVYDKPARTVVAHLYKDGNLFIHPDSAQARTFTVREAARIQSFPDDFFFEGSRTDQYKQVGNAVPVNLAMDIAKQIKIALEGLS